MHTRPTMRPPSTWVKQPKLCFTVLREDRTTEEKKQEPHSASSGTRGVVPLTTMPPRSPGTTLP